MLTKVNFLILLLGFLSAFGQAQKAFEGRIFYDVEYVSFPEGMEGVEQSLPQQMTMIVKGQNVRIIQQSALAGELLQIHRAGVDTIFQIFHFMDRHVLMAAPIENKSIKFRAIEKENVKTIANVQTHEVYLQSGTGGHVQAWVDKKHQNPLQTELRGLNYLPLEYTVIKNGITLKMIVREVKSEPIDETYFLLPENIVRISGSDLHRIMN
jgi:hypothetical protein